jgi:hypothetical protein
VVGKVSFEYHRVDSNLSQDPPNGTDHIVADEFDLMNAVGEGKFRVSWPKWRLVSGGLKKELAPVVQTNRKPKEEP